MIMITPLPGITTLKPGSATQPFPGVKADVVNEPGESVPLGGGGYLVLDRPWPAMLRGIYRDPDRYMQTYWSRYPGRYFAGDGCKRDDGGLLLAPGPGGRRDECERPPDQHHRGRVGPRLAPGGGRGRGGRPHRIRSPARRSSRTSSCGPGNEPSDALANELREHVATVIGKLARPKQVMFTTDLPKTRSGKIMRRLLRDIAEQRALGDVTTLADEGIVATIREQSGTGDDE